MRTKRVPPPIAPSDPLYAVALSVRAERVLADVGVDVSRATVADLASIDAAAAAARHPRSRKPLREIRAVALRAGLDLRDGWCLAVAAVPWVVRDVTLAAGSAPSVLVRRGRASVRVPVEAALAATLRPGMRVALSVAPLGEVQSAAAPVPPSPAAQTQTSGRSAEPTDDAGARPLDLDATMAAVDYLRPVAPETARCADALAREVRRLRDLLDAADERVDEARGDGVKAKRGPVVYVTLPAPFFCPACRYASGLP